MEPHGRSQAAHRELTISGNSRATAAGGACQSVRERCGRKAGTARVAGGARPLVSRVTGSEEGGPKGAVKMCARSEAVAAFSATIAGRAPHRRERVCDSRAAVPVLATAYGLHGCSSLRGTVWITPRPRPARPRPRRPRAAPSTPHGLSSAHTLTLHLNARHDTPCTNLQLAKLVRDLLGHRLALGAALFEVGHERGLVLLIGVHQHALANLRVA